MPNLVSRTQPIRAGTSALLVIDVQNVTYNDDAAATRPDLHRQATEIVIPNIAKLISVSRSTGIEVMFTVMESLTRDGRDRSLDYKLSGFHFPKGCWESRVIEAVKPVGDEIVIPKTSSSLFNSTNFEYVLRNIGIDQIVVTGFLTDQCVDHTIRDGADRGFLMVCAEDACATETQERHAAALGLFKGYCRILATRVILAEMAV
ncbi:MAG: cysteine hydrolase [Hyphomicrobiales bacterium]|nr:cysteine hydrolase [Hyphomicrobiales bacterium]